MLEESLFHLTLDEIRSLEPRLMRQVLEVLEVRADT
jgi:hypothetical protein